MFKINCVRLCWLLASTESIPEVCRIALLVCGAAALAKNRTYPTNHQTIIPWMIRLHLIQMLCRRRLLKREDLRQCGHLAPDSSPQLRNNFLICAEELQTRPLPLVLARRPDGTIDPWKGFTWERRTLPPTCVARGEGSTASKTLKLAHGGLLESGKGLFWKWRTTRKTFCSDQGAGERGIKGCPFGPETEVDEALARDAAALQDNDPPAPRHLGAERHAPHTVQRPRELL